MAKHFANIGSWRDTQLLVVATARLSTWTLLPAYRYVRNTVMIYDIFYTIISYIDIYNILLVSHWQGWE